VTRQRADVRRQERAPARDQEHASDRDQGGTPERSESPRRVGAGTRRVGEIIAAARRELGYLTGHEVDSVSSVRSGPEGWQITFELVELKRIPESTSVLGTYETAVDGDGSILGFERVRRYYRNQASETDLP
jgi:hypothetical protein